MIIHDVIGKLLAGDRDGTTLWKVALGEIEYDPITDPAEGVSVASLAENIMRCGQLQPILLRKQNSKRASSEKYQLIAGRRRLEAIRMLGQTHINAIVVKCESDRAGVLSLSENLLRREPDYLSLAEQILRLVKSGWQVERLASFLGRPAAELTQLLELLTLPAEELRLLRLAGIDRQSAGRLLQISDPMRRAVLEKCAASPEINPSSLIDEACANPDPRLTQTRKIMVSDIRVFLNTVERAIETMRDAGFDTDVRRDDDGAEYSFRIRVSKNQGVKLAPLRVDENVSRETSVAATAPRRFSSALSIFEALAEEECALGNDVSRETFMDGLSISRESAEKLELCIDGGVKK